MTDLEDSVRAWAQGLYPLEAGAELLIRQGKAIYPGAPWITELEPITADRPGRAAIDVGKLLYESGVWSSGEQKIVRIAASLLGDHPVVLNDDIVGLGREHLALVLAAIAHAGGSHEHHPTPFLEQPDGSVELNPDRGAVLDPLFTWPAGI